LNNDLPMEGTHVYWLFGPWRQKCFFDPLCPWRQHFFIVPFWSLAAKII